MSKTTDKKNKRVMVTVIVICAMAVLALLFIFFFADMIIGRARMNDALDALEDTEKIVVSDPLYDGGVIPGAAEAVLDGDDAQNIADTLCHAAEKLSFSKVLNGSAGFWDISLTFEDDGKTYVIYLREDSIYVAKTNGYLFKIKSSREAAYSNFYAAVTEILDRSR